MKIKIEESKPPVLLLAVKVHFVAPKSWTAERCEQWRETNADNIAELVKTSVEKGIYSDVEVEVID